MTKDEIRDRLVELIQDSVDGCATYWAGRIADGLLANGVTFAEDHFREPTKMMWIPVSERKPDLVPCGAGKAYSEAVNVLTSGRKVMTAVWDGVDFICPMSFWAADGEEITHWMPLPEVPKEVVKKNE